MKHGQSVAIVGVGGIFPMSPTLDRFWETISGNVDTSRQPPQGRWLLDPATWCSSGRNTPFAGREMRARVRWTLVAGEVVFDASSAGGMT